MFQKLIGSHPTRSWLSGGTAVSTAVHGGVAVLIAFTAHEPGLVMHDTHGVAERVTFVDMAAAPATMRRPTVTAKSATRGAHAARSPSRRSLTAVPDASALMIAVAEALDRLPVNAAPSLAPIDSDWLSRPDSLWSGDQSLGITLLGETNLHPPVDGVYNEAVVDRIVEARRTNPLPSYPETLRRRGLEGTFIVQFVVDTTGRVVEDGIRFPPTMHELFARSVRLALRRSRFLPAQIAGQVVQQLVVQEYRFVLVR
jgi:TonB family protein